MGILNSLKKLRQLFKISKRMTISELDNLMDNALYGGGRTSSFGFVDQNTAFNYSAFYSGVNQIAQTIARLPLILFLKIGERASRPYIENPLYSVLRFQANRYTNSFMWLETVMVHLLLIGNHFSYIIRDKGNRVIGLQQLNPNCITLMVDDLGDVYYKFQKKGIVEIFDRKEILHISGMGFDGIQGYSVLNLARESIGLGLAQEEFSAKFIGRGTNIGGVLKYPGKLEESAKKELKKELAEEYSGLDKAARIMVLENGIQFEKIMMPLNDAQFLESRVFQIDEIARWLNMPPHKLKQLQNATYSNIVQEQLSYLSDTIGPWLTRIERQILSQLVPNEKRHFVELEFDPSELLKTDMESMNKALDMQRRSGVINADEWRYKLGMNPIGGFAGSALWQPANMIATDKDGNKKEKEKEEVIVNAVTETE